LGHYSFVVLQFVVLQLGPLQFVVLQLGLQPFVVLQFELQRFVVLQLELQRFVVLPARVTTADLIMLCNIEVIGGMPPQ
jgi:hypothetical protein